MTAPNTEMNWGLEPQSTSASESPLSGNGQDWGMDPKPAEQISYVKVHAGKWDKDYIATKIGNTVVYTAKVTPASDAYQIKLQDPENWV